MSLIKIEYPTKDSTSVAAMMTHGEVVEKVGTNGSSFFFKVVRNADNLHNDLQLVGVWSPTENFGVVYDNPSSSIK